MTTPFGLAGLGFLKRSLTCNNVLAAGKTTRYGGGGGVGDCSRLIEPSNYPEKSAFYAREFSQVRGLAAGGAG